MKKRKTIWYFNHGKAAKYDGDPTITPKMGYNWFFWLPYIKWNGGSIFRKEVFDFGISWLCFWTGVTIYANQNVEPANQIKSEFIH
jgi:hypothetical protein